MKRTHIALSLLATYALLYIARRLSRLPFANRHHPDLRGKLAIVTGGTRGIGAEIVKGLARLGCDVVVVSEEDASKGSAAAEQIEHDARGGSVSWQFLNLADLAGLREFVRRWNDDGRKLDFLVNNAGILTSPRKRVLTKDGFEIHWTVNYLAHFYLTVSLSDALLSAAKEGGSVRIVSTASINSERFPMDWDDIHKALPGKYGTIPCYAQSKLALVLFASKLARLFQEKHPKLDIAVGSFDPGITHTSVFHPILPGGSRLFRSLVGVLITPLLFWMHTPHESAQTALHFLTAPRSEIVSGGYYVNLRNIPHRRRETEGVVGQDRLWTISGDMIKQAGLDFPRMM
ncbi:NAD(P)-binding protein [Gonapodya prolifera JEL478]|uniref:NAD(P)-binding protein n=1 Tax=Gonapodya prolifera (strain JEL478) TaxID=1344416 RepID=A0A139A1L1_GONPJ|nr:NAD(P)-binding protein [Gonapodya prolifera JEL478]|eukprot:KXS10666.1 NAD(P)-binding protein [Gonapodya prolifera JEL478]